MQASIIQVLRASSLAQKLLLALGASMSFKKALTTTKAYLAYYCPTRTSMVRNGLANTGRFTTGTMRNLLIGSRQRRRKLDGSDHQAPVLRSFQHLLYAIRYQDVGCFLFHASHLMRHHPCELSAESSLVVLQKGRLLLHPSLSAGLHFPDFPLPAVQTL